MQSIPFQSNDKQEIEFLPSFSNNQIISDLLSAFRDRKKSSIIHLYIDYLQLSSNSMESYLFALIGA